MSGEKNAKMSREMETMMDLMHSQISSAISSAISERIIPEIQNMVENLPLGQYGSTSLNEDGIRNVWKNANTKLTKKDSRSACDLRDHTDNVPYRETYPYLSALKNLIEFEWLKDGNVVAICRHKIDCYGRKVYQMERE